MHAVCKSYGLAHHPYKYPLLATVLHSGMPAKLATYALTEIYIADNT